MQRIKPEQTTQLIERIRDAPRIVVYGAGRMGLAGRGFAMRLRHLDKEAYFWGDTTLPDFGQGDLMIAASGSGYTRTVRTLLEIARDARVTTAVITNDTTSPAARLANVIVELPKIESVQPMTTLNEQCCALLFDSLVLDLMEVLCYTAAMMKEQHTNLE